MDMQGSRQLAVTQQQAWDALNDPEVLKVCIPGCDSIESTGENAYALVNAFKVGPVSARFKSALTLADIDAPSSYTLHFDGNGGAAGFGKGTAKVALKANDGGCRLDYSASASVGGKIAQVGQRLIDGVAKSMAEKFFRNFDDEMQRRHPAPTGATGAAAAADNTTAMPAAPVGLPKWVWWVLAIIVILGIVFVAY